MGVLRIYPQHTTKQEGVQVENANQQEQVGPSDAQCRYHLHQGPGRGERGIHQYPEPEQQRWIREAANPRPDRPRPGRRPGGHHRRKELEHEIPSRDLELPGQDLSNSVGGASGGVEEKGGVAHARQNQGP